MDHIRIIQVVREKLGETDLVVSDLTSPEILAFVKTSQEILELRKLTSVENLVVVSEQISTSYGITPEPTTEAGYYLALHTSLSILRSEYYSRVKTGTLGVAWRSGLEEESTISAEKAWRVAIAALEDEFEELFIIRHSTTSGFRSQ